MIEKQVFFLDIIGRAEAFSKHRFQVSGVRFQAGSHFFTTDTWHPTPETWGPSVQFSCNPPKN